MRDLARSRSDGIFDQGDNHGHRDGREREPLDVHDLSPTFFAAGLVEMESNMNELDTTETSDRY